MAHVSPPPTARPSGIDPLHKFRSALLPLGVVSASWSAIFIRFCVASPAAIAAYRMLFATAILLPFYLLHRNFRLPTRTELAMTAAAGALLAAHFYVWITGLTLTSTASATVLVTVQPLFITVMAHWLLRERIGWLDYSAIAVALGGAVLIGWGDFQLSSDHLLGDLLALSGAFFGACYLLIGRVWLPRMGGINYLFPVYLSCAVALCLTLAVTGQSFVPGEFDDLIWFLLLALVPTLLGHSSYNLALRYFRAHLIGMAILGEPILTALWAALIFAELPTLTTLLGALLIFAAIALVVYREGKVSS